MPKTSSIHTEVLLQHQLVTDRHKQTDSGAQHNTDKNPSIFGKVTGKNTAAPFSTNSSRLQSFLASTM